MYFLDTSALVKIYHFEKGSRRIAKIYQSDDEIYISEISKVEFISTVHKKCRMKAIPVDTLNALIEFFELDISNRYRIIPLTSAVLAQASAIIRRYGAKKHLVALDAIQISAFQTLLEQYEQAQFVGADKRMNDILRSMNYALIAL